jgi:hypothetical protein
MTQYNQRVPSQSLSTNTNNAYLFKEKCLLIR